MTIQTIKPITYQINAKNHAEIGGVDLVDLAGQFGSPLYVLDAASIRAACRAYRLTLKEYYPDFLVCYASKALNVIGLLDLLAEEGMGVDVVSGGELFAALKSKMNPASILFHGNNKSREELELAISNHIKIVADHDSEIELIAQIAKKLQTPVDLLIRLKPEIDAHTHDFVKTGLIDSKFGVDQKNLIATVQKIQQEPLLHFLGLHAHIGSQIFEIEPYEELVRLLVRHAKEIQKKVGLETSILNLGGGLGIYYTPHDDPPQIEELVRRISARIKLECQSQGLALPQLILEPGRSIIGKAGVTLYTVGTIKHIPDICSYLFIDGGMADNPRPMMYQARYSFELANKPTLPHDQIYTIAGKFCETGDILAKKVHLPTAEANDLLMVFATGAYNYAMSSNYNRFCKPAMVLVEKGEARLILKRETYADIVRNDV